MKWYIFVVLVIQITYIYQPAATEVSPVTRALKFGDTVNDYVSFNPDMARVKYSVAVCAWVKKQHTGTFRIWFGYNTTTQGAAILISDAGNNDIHNAQLYVADKVTVPLGTWTHQCLTWSTSSATIKTYYNGTLVYSKPDAPSLPLEEGWTLWIGRYYYVEPDNVFGGELTKLNVFGKELTAVEVAKMHAAGRCSEVEKEHEAVRFIKWEDILKKDRNGDVTEVDTGCSAQGM